MFIASGSSYGAGILADAEGHVITCHHVVAGSEAIQVVFADGASFAARVVDTDRELDLALLEIPTTRNPGLRISSVSSLFAGDAVYAMGAPRKLAFSLTRGMASFVGRPFDDVFYLQSDLPTNGGSSGGPVMNERGEVIGLSAFIFKNSEGLAFALPIDYAYRRFAGVLSGPEDAVSRDALESWPADRRLGAPAAHSNQLERRARR